MLTEMAMPPPPQSKSDPYWSIARCYSRCLDPIILRWKKRGMMLCPPLSGMHVLDVGCGTGAHLKLYQIGGCSAFGIEISPGMIATSRQKHNGRLNLCLANATRIPCRNQAFDLILLSMMIHEISPVNRLAVLAETVRVLKDSGRILIIDYHSGRVNHPIGRLLKGAIMLIEMAAGNAHFSNYRNFMKNDGIVPLLQKQRIVIRHQELAGHGNIGLYVLQKDLSADANLHITPSY
jgi:demethylmenaquinone methyltransferase/2-methoxy-6-polyprenyl-1,4-benzoquinol methylase